MLDFLLDFGDEIFIDVVTLQDDLGKRAVRADVLENAFEVLLKLDIAATKVEDSDVGVLLDGLSDLLEALPRDLVAAEVKLAQLVVLDQKFCQVVTANVCDLIV